MGQMGNPGSWWHNQRMPLVLAAEQLHMKVSGLLDTSYVKQFSLGCSASLYFSTQEGAASQVRS